MKSYLHTYSNYGGVATAVGQVESVKANATAGMTARSTTASGSGSTTGASSSASSASVAQASGTSSAGAPSQTGVLVMGMLGAVGVLGLAVAL